ncbi:MAG TPA: diaminopimelate epimerase [Streptosporangiaceae bacterium]|jgi:diaminopimelate epimerase
MRFAKGHGTQNDFVIVFDPDDSHELTAGLAARLCDRRAGIGGDGVLRAVRQRAAGSPGWFMDYRNADGSLAEMCGNGVRVFARYLVAHGLASGPEFTVATRAGDRQVRLEPDGQITVDMGAVTVLGPGQAVVAGQTHEGLRISAGNPHLACLVERPLAEFDLTRPPALDHGQFPDGANVELVRLTGGGTLAMRVHERGSGETRSCGTGAVAAAAAATRARGEQQGAWQVTVPGGTLGVVITAESSRLTGPAVIVAEGELDPGWLAGGWPSRPAERQPAGR